MTDSHSPSRPQRITRRNLLSAKITAELPNSPTQPLAQDTIRLSTNAMACEFTIMLNPGSRHAILQASDILESVHELEAQYTVYRDSSELMELNRSAGKSSTFIKPNLFDLLRLSIEITQRSTGTYNPLMHPLILLWREARIIKVIPQEIDIQAALKLSDINDVLFDPECHRVSLLKSGMSFNLGGIGKGYAIDQLASKLLNAGINDFLIHAGQSSVFASGNNGTNKGWPIGISHPNLAQRFLGTISLINQGMSTSGSGVQFYRVDGKKYGHILDPRTGMPADSTLSTMIFHQSAAMADALSTAAYVSGLKEIDNLINSFPGTKYIMLTLSDNPHEFEIQFSDCLAEIITWN